MNSVHFATKDRNRFNLNLETDFKGRKKHASAIKLKLLLLQLSFYAKKEEGKRGNLNAAAREWGYVVNAVVVTYFRFAELAQEERNYEATKY